MSTDRMEEGVREVKGGRKSLMMRLDVVTINEQRTQIDFMLEFTKNDIVLSSSAANGKAGLRNGSVVLEAILNQVDGIDVRAKVETDFVAGRHIVKSLTFPLAQP